MPIHKYLQKLKKCGKIFFNIKVFMILATLIINYTYIKLQQEVIL